MSLFNSTTEIKSYLKITSGDDDIIIDVIATGIDDKILTKIEKKIFSAAFVQTYNGNGQSRLWLRDGPIIAVSELKINEQLIPQASSSLTNGFLFDENELYLNGTFEGRLGSVRRFERGHQNIKVSYTGGVVTAPGVLRLAHLKQVGYEYRQRDRVGVKNETLGPDQTVGFITDEWAPGVEGDLERFRSKVPVP